MLKNKIMAGLIMSACIATSQADSKSVWDALKGGSPTVDLRLRYENVDNDAGSDIKDLTLRTAVGYKTGSFNDFSAYVQLEDISIIDDNDIANADGKTSEVNQAYLNYKSNFDLTLGRQTIIYDNARHIGNVGWRQNDQTFDALTFKYTGIENFTFSYNYIWQVNRIFATREHSSHHLANLSYNFGPAKLTGYTYLVDFDVDENLAGRDFQFTDDTDTYGLRLTGGFKTSDSIKFIYSLEYAMQSEGSDALTSYDADYTLAELGFEFSAVTLKAGYEVLGEDNGKSFATPLATVHAFNGWADKNIVTQIKGNGNGIEDTYFSVGGKLAGISLLGVYHDLATNSGTTSYEGSEIDLLAVYKTKYGPVIGAKAAFFDSDTNAQDIDKFWIWTQYKI